ERCVHGLPGVFDAQGRPWVNPDGASADAIVVAVSACPTGALTAARHDGGEEEIPDSHVSVTCLPDGPVHVRGPLTVGIPGSDEPMRVSRAAFCRCGKSANKPYCDNAHLEASFEAGDLAEMPERAVDEVPAVGGATATPLENGPLLLGGTVRFTDAGGTVGWIANPALCRCGLSANKPFCDGSHKDGAFISPGAG
ncbi:MAG: CDGSH iron-sulfur domain-containing protein, partial [Gemmatimonadota bacterium]|nr:CDGSH iron-sulfur domain-containing protein [Gemmatimonadota bacterium]